MVPRGALLAEWDGRGLNSDAGNMTCPTGTPESGGMPMGSRMVTVMASAMEGTMALQGVVTSLPCDACPSVQSSLR